MATEVKAEGLKALSWRSFMALLFIVAIIQPAILYNWLVNGLWGLPLTSWAVILLWVGISRIAGTTLNQKEIFVIRMFESMGLMYMGYYFAYLLRNQYFANSEIAALFGLQHLIPPYFSPLGQDALRSMVQRTFLDYAWILPILVCILIPVGLSSIANFTLGLLAYKLYVEEEKLEFPLASWDAITMKALGQREHDKMRVIILSIMAGAIYGSVTYGLTSLLGVTLFPRILVDLTSALEVSIPGASFAFSTDLLPYLVGFILPIRVTALQFIASLAIYVVGNAYVTMNNLWPSESLWVPGQGILWLYSRSTVYFWNSFTLGWGLAVATIPLAIRFKSVARAFTKIGGSFSGTGRGFLSAKSILIIYLATAGTSIFILYLLVPGFPVWIALLFTLGISFFVTLLQAHSAGVTVGFNVPYLREALIYFSGYRGLDIWFIPQDVVLFLYGSNITQQLKMANIIGIDLKEYFKAYIIIIVLGLLGSFTFVSLFWFANPIPGWAYPYTISAWPVEAMNFWRWQSWLWTGYLFRKEWIIYGFSISAILYLISDLILKFPSAPVVMMMGMLQVPYLTLAQFLGSLASHFIRKFWGKELWDSSKGFIYLGVTIGDGIISTILTMSALIGKSMWLKPY